MIALLYWPKQAFSVSTLDRPFPPFKPAWPPSGRRDFSLEVLPPPCFGEPLDGVPQHAADRLKSVFSSSSLRHPPGGKERRSGSKRVTVGEAKVRPARPGGRRAVRQGHGSVTQRPALWNLAGTPRRLLFSPHPAPPANSISTIEKSSASTSDPCKRRAWASNRSIGDSAPGGSAPK